MQGTKYTGRDLLDNNDTKDYITFSYIISYFDCYHVKTIALDMLILPSKLKMLLTCNGYTDHTRQTGRLTAGADHDASWPERAWGKTASCFLRIELIWSFL